VTDPYYRFHRSEHRDLASLQVTAVLDGIYQGQREDLRDHMLHLMAKAERYYVERERVRPGGRYTGKENVVGKDEIKEDAPYFEPRRYWSSKDPEQPKMRVYVGIKGRATLADLMSYVEENSPGVGPSQIELNFASAVWTEPPTAEEIEQNREWEATRELNREEWERKQYEKLKAKFGS